jgi:hypothetical protein
MLVEFSYYQIDPGYTTTYMGFGANTDRDEVYTLPRQGEAQGEGSPDIDDGNYWLIEDDDDDDDWPDSEDFDGVLPQADDRDQNGILDYQEDFLVFEADPPIFSDITDMNHNMIIDELEDDYEPDYPYGIDRKGYHIIAGYDVLENLTISLGWLNERQISSERKNDTKYAHGTYQRDIPGFGTLRIQDRFDIVKDSIPDYAITLLVGALEAEETQDALDFFNAWINTATIQFIYTAVPNLTLETKYLNVFQQQNQPDDAQAVQLNPDNYDPETDPDERIDFRYPEEQVRESGDMRDYPFYPDPELVFNKANWRDRRYPDKTITQQTFIFKTKYELSLGGLPLIGSIGEDFTLTPMFKYMRVNDKDRKEEDLPVLNDKPRALDYRYYGPTHPRTEEYLRFNRNVEEIIELVRLDYQFTQRMSILGGFQFRRIINKDQYFENYLEPFEGQRVSSLYRPTQKTRIFEIQAINKGEWLGFSVVVLLGFRHRRDLMAHVSADTWFVRALMGF